MKIADIRKAYLDYFVENGHTLVPSSSLVPLEDPTLLFVNSGMVQFKDCFLGTDPRGLKRATSAQKCLRLSGKHNDFENVGRTARHHTFFEMMGNFSFGDYFKKEAIGFAWELLTKRLKLPKEKLWVTIYKDDDEAFKLWSELTDVLPGRILRFGEDDNFWTMGDTGPCGPSSEIFYFFGDDVENQSEEDFRNSDGRYTEIWNLVFTQFDRDPSGKLTLLPRPSVDTGMGLERMASVAQGVKSNFDTDILRNIIAYTERLSGKGYDGRDYRPRDPKADPQYAFDVAHRVVADHSRAVAFLIAEGVSPSSEGRGYVLRRLIRRACRHGRNLGFKEPFLHKVTGTVIEQMGDAYPELKNGAVSIDKQIAAEEERFLQTLDGGLALLTKETNATKSKGGRTLPGDVAFLLHDTYGFPLDLTEDILKSEGISVDQAGFKAAMESQRERSRAARASESGLALQRVVKALPSTFVGYEFEEYDSTISALFGVEGEQKFAKTGDEVALVAAETPFYAESGGQIGDTGKITSSSAVLDVLDTQKVNDTIVHVCHVTEGTISTGDRVRLAIDAERRNRLRANHSATHLLHLALREVLGDHVKQAGSRVADTAFRFDFSHFEAVTSEQLDDIQSRINRQVRANPEVKTTVMPVEDAKKSGAMALFGEKYGTHVRVVEIGPKSKELCGGTHVKRAGDIGSVVILSDSAVSAGVRRIEALGGLGAEKFASNQKQTVQCLSQLLKTSEAELPERVSKLLERVKELEQTQNAIAQKQQASLGKELIEQAKTSSDGFKVLATVVPEAEPKRLRELADDLRNRLGSACVALASVMDGKVILLTAVTDDLVGKQHAGNLAQELVKVLGGKGGGRADLAQAGGGDPSKLDAALDRFRELVS